MSWPSNQVPKKLPDKDAEGISVEAVYGRAYSRAAYCLGDEIEAHRIAKEVCILLWRKWLREEEESDPANVNFGETHDSNSEAYKHRNRAYCIDIETHAEIREYRRRLMKADHKVAIDKETLTVWFVEELVTFILNHDSSYAAVGILMILCTFDYDDVQDLFVHLNANSSKMDDVFRKNKKRCFDWLYTEFRGFVQSAKKHKQPSRFVSQPASGQSSDLIDIWLSELVPLRPLCYLCQTASFDPDDDLERLLKDQVRSTFAHTDGLVYLDAIERERIQIMICPKCLTRYLAAFNRIDWKEKLGLPEFFPEERRGGKPPLNRESIPRLSEAEARLIHKVVLGKQDLYFKAESPGYISVKVDGNERRRIKVEKATTEHFHLRDGENVIKLSYVDQDETIPLDVHFVSWDKALVKNVPLNYITRLDDDHSLAFCLTYDRSGGELSGASVDVRYSCPARASRFANLVLRVKNAASSLISNEGASASEGWVYVSIAITALALFGGLFYFATNARHESRTNSGTDPFGSHSAPAPSELSSKKRSESISDLPIDFSNDSDKKIKRTRFDGSATKRPRSLAASSKAIIETQPGRLVPNKTSQNSSASVTSVTDLSAMYQQKIMVTSATSTPAARILGSYPEGSDKDTYGETPKTEDETRSVTSEASASRAYVPYVPNVSSARNDSVASRIRIQKGQLILVRSQNLINSATSKVGDEFTTVVVNSVYAGGKEVIPNGSLIKGRVSKAVAASQFGDNGILEVKFYSLNLANSQAGPIKIKGRLYAPSIERPAFVGDAATGVLIGSMPENVGLQSATVGSTASFAGRTVVFSKTRKVDAVLTPAKEFEIILKENASVFQLIKDGARAVSRKLFR